MRTKLISHPENDPSYRYVLGNKGDNNILVIALNPSSANVNKHDGTSDNIEKIAKLNGYDGWALFNLSPERTPYPYMLSKKPNDKLFKENRKLLLELIKDENWKINDVWLAWGNNIGQFSYLKEQAIMIFNDLKDYSLNYHCIKITSKGHPYHPAKQSVNRYMGPLEKIKFIPFGIEFYQIG
ncbi:MAG: DUF1643 domain-containing protein [Maribacter arcticus]|uniref:DUF1643 domain-containing protein n=1 Tax=Maribacter arcticus TaxID=561365 RepID=UPI0030037F11